MMEGTIGSYQGARIIKSRPMGGIAAAIAGVLASVNGAPIGPARGLPCAAFERLGYVPPGPRKLRSDPAIVRQLRMEAIERRLRKNRKRARDASRSAEGRWRW